MGMRSSTSQGHWEDKTMDKKVQYIPCQHSIIFIPNIISVYSDTSPLSQWSCECLLGYQGDARAQYQVFSVLMKIEGFFFLNLKIFFLNLFLIEGQLLYNVVLVSAIQQCVSAVSIHISPLAWASLPPLPPPTHLGHHRAPSWVPCTIQLFFK